MAKNDVKIKLVGEDKLSDSIKKVKKELKETSKSGKSLDDLKKKFEKLESSTKPFNVKIKETKRLMVELSQEYNGEGSAYWYKMAKSVAGYQDALKMANADITTVGSGTKNFEALTSAAQGFAGAMGIVNGAMALFGENEELTEAAKKAQGAIAMMQGIASLANTLDVHSKLMVVIRERWAAFKKSIDTAKVANEAFNATEAAKAALTSTSATSAIATASATASNVQSTKELTKAEGERRKIVGNTLVTDKERIIKLKEQKAQLERLISTTQQSINSTKALGNANKTLLGVIEALNKTLGGAETQLTAINAEITQLEAQLNGTANATTNLSNSTAQAGNQAEETKVSFRLLGKEITFTGKAAKGLIVALKGLKAALKTTIFIAVAQIILEYLIPAIESLVKWIKEAIWGVDQMIGKVGEMKHASTFTKELKEEVRGLNTAVGETVGKFKSLQAQWSKLSSEKDKAKWIKEHKTEFDGLGLSIKNTADATKVFVNDSDKYLAALKKHALYTAAAALYAETYRKKIEAINKVIAETENMVTSIAADPNKRGEQAKRAANEWAAAGLDFDNMVSVNGQFTLGESQKQIYRDWILNRRKEQLEGIEEGAEESLKRLEKILKDNMPTDDLLKFETKDGSSKSKKSYEKDSIAYLEALKKETEAKITNKKVTLEEADALRLLVRQLDLYIEARKRAIKLNATTDELFSTSDNYRWAKKKLNVPLQLDKDGLAKMRSETSKQIGHLYNQEELKKQWDKNMELKAWENQFKKIEFTANSVGQAFNGLGSAIEGMGDSMDNAAGKIISGLGGVANSIPALVAQYKDLFYASEATAVALGIQQGAAIPFPANLAAIASIVGTITSIIGSFAGKFASGGIVGGSSYAGDNLYARVNSGEMILNSTQQGNLFRMLSSGTVAGATPTLEAKVRGSDLYFALSNYNKKQSKL